MKFSSQTLQLNTHRNLVVPEHHVCKKKLIGIFGESGCGKSSFLQYLYNHYTCQKIPISYMKQDIVLHPQLTVRETLWFLVSLRSEQECSNIDNVMRKLHMTYLLDQKIGSYKLSGGEKKRVMIAFHLLNENAEYFLLDEPFSGIDPENTELIFTLFQQKVISHQQTIIMTIHQLPVNLQQLLDEYWNVVPSNDDTHTYRLSINQNMYDDRLSFVDLEEDNNIANNSEYKKTEWYKQWWHLFYRDRVIDSYDKLSVFFHWITPLLVILLQELFIGSFSKYLNLWISTGDKIDLFKMIFIQNIFLFSTAIIPIHMLNDHFNKRSIINHEISQGMYSKYAYLFSAIIWDQFSIIIISLCVALVCFVPDYMFLTTFFNIGMEMLFTNMLMWFCSFFIASSFNMILIIVSTYISISFIANLGVLLCSNKFGFIQYLSMTHIQSNIFIKKLINQFPGSHEQLGSLLSFFNIYNDTISLGGWVGISLCFWAVLPLLMISNYFFHKLK